MNPGLINIELNLQFYILDNEPELNTKASFKII